MKLTITLEDVENCNVAYTITRSSHFSGEFTEAEMFAAMIALEAEERGYVHKEGTGNVVQLRAV